MFIISLTYKSSIEDVEKYLPDHIAFLDKYYMLEKFIFSGRKIPRTGGIILAHNISKDEVERIIKEDPFSIHNMANYDITEIFPTKYDKRFEVFVR